ncbi:hypothetical protein MSR1_00080 [Magnetospirillum gryphiswaldense MSR-1]|nr:hypothetical protein MSR1_00080 [Magnetospirillum gryphiswaldense MSR-1]AVM76441.1 hypothetical protein MSR1L_00080 [Magnetospirillum gryphiswaldense]
MDRVVFAFNAILPVKGRLGWLAFRDALRDRGLLVKPNKKVGEAYETLEMAVTLSGLPDGGEAQVTACLSADFSDPDRGVLFRFGQGKKATVLRLNLMSALASTCGRDQIVALDGGTNVCGATSAMTPDAYNNQLHLLRVMVDRFFGLIEEAAGGAVQGELIVRQAEVCRDMSVRNAIETVSKLDRVVLPGCGEAHPQLCYPAPGGGSVEAYYALSWREDLKTPMLRAKLYPKTLNLIRAEIAYDSRSAIRAEVDTLGERARWGELNGSDAVKMVDQAFAAALPSLRAVTGLVTAVADPQADYVDLLVALMPLLQVIKPPPSQTGPKTTQTKATAEKAVRSLLQSGTCTVTGLDSKHPVHQGGVGQMRVSRRHVGRCVAEDGLDAVERLP